MKHIAFFFSVITLVASVSAGLRSPMNRINPKDPRAIRLGGVLERPKKGGAVHFVNAQKRVPEEKLKNMATKLGSASMILVAYTNGTPVAFATASSQMRKMDIPAAVYIVEDKDNPEPFVVQPEAHWAIVNVSALAADGAKEPFVVARTLKEIGRAFFMVTGGMASDHTSNLLGTIQKPADLDEYRDDAFPMDVLMRSSKYAPAMGLHVMSTVSYQQACREGWAPAPTNDIQKAIWDKVHAMPTAPLKIKPETKKVAE